MPMSRPTRDSETQAAVPYGSIELESSGDLDSSEGQAAAGQLPLFLKILDQLDREEVPPRQRIEALRSLRRPLLVMVRALSRQDAREPGPKIANLSPSPAPAQRLLERMCRNLDHLLLALDRRRFRVRDSVAAERRWTIHQLFRFLGYQIEYGILANRPWPARTWQRIHDLFEYLIERGDLELGYPGAEPGKGFDPETPYKRLLLLSLVPRLRGTRRLDPATSKNLTAWAGQTRLVDPAGRLGDYGLLVVESSRDAPARFRAQPADDPWRGWTLEPPAEFLAFAGIERPSLSLQDPNEAATFCRRSHG
jgi:hypothetical protein